MLEAARINLGAPASARRPGPLASVRGAAPFLVLHPVALAAGRGAVDSSVRTRLRRHIVALLQVPIESPCQLHRDRERDEHDQAPREKREVLRLEHDVQHAEARSE